MQVKFISKSFLIAKNNVKKKRNPSNKLLLQQSTLKQIYFFFTGDTSSIFKIKRKKVVRFEGKKEEKSKLDN